MPFQLCNCKSFSNNCLKLIKLYLNIFQRVCRGFAACRLLACAGKAENKQTNCCFISCYWMTGGVSSSSFLLLLFLLLLPLTLQSRPSSFITLRTSPCLTCGFWTPASASLDHRAWVHGCWNLLLSGLNSWHSSRGALRVKFSDNERKHGASLLFSGVFVTTCPSDGESGLSHRKV